LSTVEDVICIDSRVTDGGKVVSLTTGRALFPETFLFLSFVLTSVKG
jgi:hypothetical protein